MLSTALCYRVLESKHWPRPWRDSAVTLSCGTDSASRQERGGKRCHPGALVVKGGSDHGGSPDGSRPMSCILAGHLSARAPFGHRGAYPESQLAGVSESRIPSLPPELDCCGRDDP